MNNNKNKSIFPLVLIFLFIIALVGGAYWYGKQNALVKEEERIEEEKSKESTSSKEEEKKETPEKKEEDTNEEIVLAFQELFAVKYNRKAEDVHLSISERKGDFFIGGVKFGDELAGGYVLGAKVNGEWRIVFDGNGVIPCNSVDDANFPSDMVGECWNTTDNTIIDRVTGQVKQY